MHHIDADKMHWEKAIRVYIQEKNYLKSRHWCQRKFNSTSRCTIKIAILPRSKDKTEEFENTFLHWVETYALSLDRLVVETRHYPVLRRITSRIRKKCMGQLFRAERP